jgi:hypothetical protein
VAVLVNPSLLSVSLLLAALPDDDYVHSFGNFDMDFFDMQVNRNFLLELLYHFSIIFFRNKVALLNEISL